MAIYIAMLTGSVVLISIALIFCFRKATYIDQITKKPIEFDLPIMGKVRTQSPLIALAALGAFLVAYGLHSSQLGIVSVKGKINSSKPVTIYFVGIPAFEYRQEYSNDLATEFPLLPNVHYRAKFVVDGQIVDDRPLTIQGNEVDLGIFTGPHTGSEILAPKRESTDNEVREFLRKK